MRTIHADLLAAAQSLRGVPAVTCEIRDKRLRWRALEDHGATSTCPVTITSATQILWRSRVDGSGDMAWQRITNPALTAQWQAWNVETPTIAAFGEAAIAADSPINVRLAYMNGGNCDFRESTDGGSSWSAAANISAPGVGHLVAASGTFVAHYNAAGYVLVWQKAIGSGAWDMFASKPLGGAVNLDGLAIAVKYTPGTVYVAMCLDGVLSVQPVSYPAGTWGDEVVVDPPWSAATPEDWYPTRCSIATMNDTDLALAWVDHRDTVEPTWSLVLGRRSTDGVSWGQEVALSLVWSTERGVAVCGAQHADDRYFYACVEKQVVRSRSFAEDSSDQHIDGLSMVEYEFADSANGPAIMSCKLLDKAGTLKGLGDAGEAAEAIALLAELHVERGYLLSGAATLEALPPMLITGCAYTVGRDRGWIQIDATDTLGLMDRVSLRRPLAAAGLTFAELAQRLVAQVGFEFTDDGDAAFDRVVTSFASPPGATLGGVFRRLMGLCGAVYRVAESGNLYAIQYGAYAPGTKPPIGDESEIQAASFGMWLPRATRVLWAGESSTAWEDTDASMRLGARLEWHIVDRHADSAAIAGDAAETAGMLAAGALDWDRVTVHIRPDLELWDIVEVTTDTDVLPAATERVVVAIQERFEAVRGRFEGRYTLQGG